MAGHSRVSTVHGNRFRAAEHYRGIFSAVNVKRFATLALLAATPALQIAIQCWRVYDTHCRRNSSWLGRP